MPVSAHPLMILVAGPYRSGTGDDPAKLAANVDAMNQAALALFRAGHLPVTGEALALPLIETAGSAAVGDPAFDAIFHPISEQLLARCDAVLRIGGPSAGADMMVAQASAQGKQIFHQFDEIPAAGTVLAGSAAELRLVIIIGSTRPGRFGPTVARWFIDQAGQHGGLDVDVVDLAEEEVEALGERLAAADAFVVVTPEYNHSFPGPLKGAIDHYKHEWRAKPVAFVSYGGVSGGLRAVEQLRLVFAELHAMTVRNAVSFTMAHKRFDDNGRPLDEADANGAAKDMLNQLGWWAHALRDARAARPYGG
jgi:NAD(P)H-dependent FMN reductase